MAKLNMSAAKIYVEQKFEEARLAEIKKLEQKKKELIEEKNKIIEELKKRAEANLKEFFDRAGIPIEEIRSFTHSSYHSEYRVCVEAKLTFEQKTGKFEMHFEYALLSSPLTKKLNDTKEALQTTERKLSDLYGWWRYDENKNKIKFEISKLVLTSERNILGKLDKLIPPLLKGD